MLQTTHDQSAVQNELTPALPQERLAGVVSFLRRQYPSWLLPRLSGSGLVWFT